MRFHTTTVAVASREDVLCIGDSAEVSLRLRSPIGVKMHYSYSRYPKDHKKDLTFPTLMSDTASPQIKTGMRVKPKCNRGFSHCIPMHQTIQAIQNP